MYEGTFYLDKKHGFGRQFWSNGTYYVGEFENDNRTGYGLLVHKDGKEEEGIWKDNKLVEEFTSSSEEDDSDPEAKKEESDFSGKFLKKKAKSKEKKDKKKKKEVKKDKDGKPIKKKKVKKNS